MSAVGFEHIKLATVSKRITFPSVMDYVRFQLVATPMANLLADRSPEERESIITAVASGTQSLLAPDMVCDGCLSFPQEAHVALARNALVGGDDDRAIIRQVDLQKDDEREA